MARASKDGAQPGRDDLLEEPQGRSGQAIKAAFSLLRREQRSAPMFSHVTVGCHDLERAERFYDAVLLPLGLNRRAVTPDGGPAAACWVHPDQILPRFYVYLPFDRQPMTAGNGSMVAFLAPSSGAVDAAYAAGMALGGTSEGAPGPRPHYGFGYYGAYLRDPDGNKIHIVHRGDLFADRAIADSQ